MVEAFGQWWWLCVLLLGFLVTQFELYVSIFLLILQILESWKEPHIHDMTPVILTTLKQSREDNKINPIFMSLE